MAGWDGTVNDEFDKILVSPFPIPPHLGDESDLEATYPAASYDRCWIWVDHTIDGWTIYESNGSAWAAKTFGGGGGAADSVLAPLAVAVTDEITALETATAAITFQIPDDFTLVSVFASLTEESSSGAVQVDLNLTGTGTIFSTPITIDVSELSSLTAATPPVLSTTAFSQGDEITVDIDSAGTGAKGLKIYMIGTYSNTFPNYSTSEVAVGIDWTNGDPIYRKTLTATLPNNNTASTAHGITTISKVVKAEGRYLDASSDWQMLPRASHIANDNIQLAVDGTNVMLRSGGDHSGGSEATVDVYYTKV